MRIQKVATIPVKIPFKEEYVHQDGNYPVLTGLEHVIVKIHTDKGILGVGEAVCDEIEISYAILRGLAKAIIGEAPYEIERIHRKMKAALHWTYGMEYQNEKAAIDMALYDIIGKGQKLPIYKLIGGRHRTELVGSRPVLYKTTEEMVRIAVKFKDEGTQLCLLRPTAT